MDLANAQTTNLDDRDKIFQAVKATVGFAEANQQVNGLLREWMIQRGKYALRRLLLRIELLLQDSLIK